MKNAILAMCTVHKDFDVIADEGGRKGCASALKFSKSGWKRRRLISQILQSFAALLGLESSTFSFDDDGGCLRCVLSLSPTH